MGSELRFQLSLSLAVALYCVLAGAPVQAGGLPVPCAGGTCAGGPSVWVTQGAATAVTNPAGTQLDITQTTDKAVLNWAEFNVDAGNTVNFSQPGANSLALNKIFQGDPSRIFGSVTANGQIYLINQNGILFGKDSQVNVGALVASSLAIDPEAESGGILNPALLRQGKPAFRSDGRVFVVDASGQVVTGEDGQPIPVKVVVEEGAKITSSAAGGGSVALLGQQVENAGRIESPSGQVILAAGQKVYLQASESPNLRGLLVEVDAGGTAWNKATGQIASTQGNVSMVGLAVNQDGRVSATTSVQSNGSVRLLARDTVTIVQGTGSQPPTINTGRAGAVTLGAGSLTQVGLDAATAGKTAVADQAQPLSSVEVVGRQVEMQAGSTIRVPGGSVAITALPNPGERPAGDTPLAPDAESRIRLAAGSLIDVAGSDAEVDLARNLVEVELRSNELRDSPVQRNGALRGTTVIVDSRVGTPLADVAGATASAPQDARERTSAGGTVSLVSRGDVVLAEGATIDVSGGAVNYRGGVLQTTRVVTADGRGVDISRADPDRIYQGVRNPTVDVVYTKWGVVETRATPGIALYRPGYVEGRDAGTVQFVAPKLVVNGDLLGGVRTSVFQRTAETRPAGGQLIVGLPDGSGLDLPDYRAPSINFTNGIVPVTVTPGAPLPETWQRLELPTRYLTEGGFTRTRLFSNGVISLGADTDLDLAPGSTLQLQGSVVDVAGNVRAPGGVVAVKSVLVNSGAVASGDRRPGVFLADGVAIDVSGRWVNDLPGIAGGAPADPLFINAGRIDLQVSTLGGELALGSGVTLRADGGAALGADGSLTAGSGGTLSLQALGPQAALATGSGLQLSAFALGKGGSLTFGANRLLVAGAGPAFGTAQRADPGAGDSPFTVATSLFQEGGFASFSLVASGGRAADASSEAVEPLTIAAGATVEPRISLLALNPGFRSVRSGADLRDLSSVYLPTADVRPAASVAFAVTPHNQVTPATAGDLLLAAGSTVQVEPTGRVAFAASSRIRLDGSVVAPGGQIVASLGNPPGALEEGFDAGAGIYVGTAGRLDARGVAILTPNDSGFRQGRVLDGGSIALSALRGRVELAAGAELDVSGTATELDLPTGGTLAGGAVLRPSLVASRGGAIDLVAPEGLRLDGALRGAGGAANAEGGRLSLGVSRLRGFNAGAELLPTFPTGPRQILVTNAPTGAGANGVAEFDPGRVASGGFDSLALQADGEILFVTDTSLAVRNRLALEAPNLRAAAGVGNVALAANYLALGPRLSAAAAPAASQSGTASLRADAGLIDLFGRSSLQGFGATVLAARTDIRATGLPVSAGTSLPGAFSAAGRLDLRAAQVYPTTFSDFRVDVTGAGDTPGVLRIAGNGATPGPVLSAAGRLRFAADEIIQAGAVRAPLGQVEFLARDSLTLAAGSLTSTAAGGQLLPFGRVAGGTSWTYESVPGLTPDIAAPPDKRVRLEGQAISVADGAVVDLSGGGDLYAYEFLPGPGGSLDALAPGVNPNLYAVLPGGSAFAAYDTQEYAGSGLKPGDSVRLAGVPGLLAAGEYALLPARYALLPGAVLVEVVPGVQDLGASQVAGLPDGTPVVAGVRMIAGTDIADSRTTGFAIRPGSYARQLAEYRDSYGNTFFSGKAAAVDQPVPPVARDAGSLQLLVGDTLALGGTLRLDADRGDPARPEDDGRGGRLDLSAGRLRIVESVGAVADGIVEVAASLLNRIAADSVLLGGTRTVLAERTEIAPVASTVEVAGGLGLSGSEYLLVARDQVTIGDNASVRSSGAATAKVGGALLITGSGGSALVRVSRNGPVQVERAAGAVAAGNILIGDGAALGAAGSITVDAGATARSFGSYDLGSDAALALGSRRIVLGAEQSAVVDGLALNGDALLALGRASEVALRAREELQVDGAVTLGNVGQRPDRLTLDAPVVRTMGGSAAFAAAELTLRNSGPALAGEPATGPGTLALTADRLFLGGGDVALEGFATVSLGATRGTTASGEARLRSGADLVLSTPFISGTPGSELEIVAAGRTVELATPVVMPPTVVAAPVGAALEVSAGRIVADTQLLYPAGRVRLAADDRVELGERGLIDVSGRRLNLAGATVDVAGGDVQVVARAGSVDFLAGSRIDVSSGTGAAGAGALGILGGGTVSLEGSLAGAGPAAGSSGSFTLTAGALTGFAGLNQQLNAGGFGRRRSVETLSGDLRVEAGDAIRARQVTLAASGGSLTLAGRIDARAPGGGTVLLAARDDLTLASGAEVDARASAAGEGAGRVTVASTDGDITLETGSRIRLDGFDGATGGELLIRAGATANDIRIAGLGAAIEGAARTIIGPVLRSDPISTLDAFITGSLRSLLDAFMAIAPASIRSRLGLDAATPIRPGLEVLADSDLTLADSWNLADWRWDGQPGYLGLRAPGNLTLQANLSDGFTQTGTVQNQLTGDSWSFDLVAGADLGSVLPGGVIGRLLDTPASGSLELGDGLLIRTGTGDIRLAAARDLMLAGPTSTVYTAGVAARQAVNIGTFRANWSRDGGDISLAAGRDIVATLPGQVLSGWNVRNLGSSGRAQWAIDYGRFRQGVAALAGGALDISAGRDILNLSGTVATTSGDLVGTPGAFDTWGGGSLRVAAGRDLAGGTYSIWQGNGAVTAGRSVALGTTADLSELGVTLAAGAGTLSVSARKDLDVGAILNPTVVPSVNPSSVYFYTWRPDDALDLTAVGGRLRLLNDLDAFALNVGGDFASLITAFGVGAPTLRARAASGDFELVREVRLLPAPRGQVEIIAAGSVRASDRSVPLLMSDSDPATLPTAARPTGAGQLLAAVSLSSDAAIHTGDDQPVALIAAGGDILGGAWQFAKQFRAIAGGDIRDLSLSGQNTSASQISLIQAGRDIDLNSRDNPRNSSGNRIELGGPGRLQVLAGRNMSLGFSRGITTIGNSANPQLPAGGAALDVWTGLGGTPDYAAFNSKYWGGQYSEEFNRYLEGPQGGTGLIAYVADITGRSDLTPDNVWSAYADLDQDDRQAYLATLAPDQRITFTSFVDLVDALVAWTNTATGRSDLTPTSAVAGYRELGTVEQRPLIQEFFFRELRDSGRLANLPRGAFGFARGETAVATLFPVGEPFAGDMSLLFSRLYTLDGGDISLLAPGGLLNVGLAQPPANLPVSKKPSDLGIVAQGAGRVQVFSDGDVLVNQSRIFTLAGGDILIWSGNGDIDAGRGSKSAISAPPPVIRVDANGQVTVEFSDAIAGSGIRGILTSEDIEPGDVDLIAPTGVVNAGDAGIGAAGNLNIAAPQVVGLDNIQVGGISAGVPTDSGAAAGLTGISSLSSSVANAAEAAAVGDSEGDANASLADQALGWLEVFIDGFGDGDEDEKEERRRRGR
ncbi:MAG: filamentous hemagglutinin family protein [Chromatiales bacterium]|nr:filamentous hemagglutinin family protein [Chromatiales bacterium]